MSSLPTSNGAVQREHQLALVGATPDPDPGPAIAGVEVPRETATTDDGYIYDLATGEVLGHIEADERFEVHDTDSANWVLQKRSQIEGRMTGLIVQRKALLEQIDALIAVERRKLSWWDYRFAPSLTAFARQSLEGAKGKTARFIWGFVAFRKSKGTTSIIDDTEALAFVDLWAPQLVKVVRSVNVTAVKGAIDVARQACPDDRIETPWLVTSGELENVTISTGIEVKP